MQAQQQTPVSASNPFQPAGYTPAQNTTQNHIAQHTLKARVINPAGATTSQEIAATSVMPTQQINIHNPSITINWEDGYSLTVTESECLSRFGTTFRDLCNLKVVAKGDFHKMWRWSTAWRCAGFLGALRHFNCGKIPADLYELGYKRPTDLQKRSFSCIHEKAIQQAK